MDKLLAVICAFFLSVNDFLFKTVVNGKDSRHTDFFYLVQVGFVMAACLTAHIIFKAHITTDPASIGFGALIGLLAFVSYKLVFKCLESEDTASNITVYRLNFVVASCLSIVFLNEELTASKAAGIACCIAAVIVFSSTKKSGSRFGTSGLKYSIPVLFVNGIINFCVKLALNNHVEVFTILFYRFIVMFLMIILMLALKGERPHPTVRLGGLGCLSGLILLLELYLFYLALSMGEVIVVTPITQMSFVATAFLLFVFLRERFGIRKIVSICFAVASIVVIGLK